jgi:hypothetical protein
LLSIVRAAREKPGHGTHSKASRSVILGSPEFAKAAHSAIDRRGLSRMTIAKRDAEVERLTQEITSIEAEIERRQLDLERVEGEAGIKAKFEQVAAEGDGLGRTRSATPSTT